MFTQKTPEGGDIYPDTGGMPMTLKSAITTNQVSTMSIENTGIKRRPTHPGEILREDFLPDYHLSIAELARHLSVSRQSVNELLKERRALTPAMALRLSRLFGNSPEFWLNAQRAVDLWDAAQAIEKEVSLIKPLAA